MKEKSFKKYKQSSDFIYSTIPKGYSLYNNNSTFIYPIYTFRWRENIIVYTPNQDTNREKYFNHIICTGKDADSGGK